MPIFQAIFFQRRVGNLVGLLVCAGLIAYALYSQYVLGFEPCPLCIFQRVAVIAVGIGFLAAFLHGPLKRGATIYGALISLLALLGALISIRHIWIQAQPEGAVASCGATLGYMLDTLKFTTVIAKVLTGSGECHAINWTLLGLSMPWWVLLSFIGLMAWALWVNVIAPRKLAVG